MSLRTIALTARLRGAETVIVGIQPDVAVAMVHFELNLEPLHTALDLEEGLELLDTLDRRRDSRWSMRFVSPSPPTPTSCRPARRAAHSQHGSGFSKTDTTLIATAISEIARNIVVHVGEGEISIEPIDEEARCGCSSSRATPGPGIRDVEAALRTGHGSTRRARARPAGRAPVDGRVRHRHDRSARGTTVTMKKWRVRDELERLREARNGSR